MHPCLCFLLSVFVGKPSISQWDGELAYYDSMSSSEVAIRLLQWAYETMLLPLQDTDHLLHSSPDPFGPFLYYQQVDTKDFDEQMVSLQTEQKLQETRLPYPPNVLSLAAADSSDLVHFKKLTKSMELWPWAVQKKAKKKKGEEEEKWMDIHSRMHTLVRELRHDLKRRQHDMLKVRSLFAS